MIVQVKSQDWEGEFVDIEDIDNVSILIHSFKCKLFLTHPIDTKLYFFGCVVNHFNLQVYSKDNGGTDSMRPETIIYTTTANAIITVNTFCVAASGISTIRTVNPQMRLSCAQNKLTLQQPNETLSVCFFTRPNVFFK